MFHTTYKCNDGEILGPASNGPATAGIVALDGEDMRWRTLHRRSCNQEVPTESRGTEE